MTSLELLICFLLVFVSGITASSEIALFSLSRFQLRALKERLRPGAHRKIKRLLEDPGGLLITILVITEIVNVALSAMITHAVTKTFVGEKLAFGSVPGWLVNSLFGTLLTAPVVLFFCEITPKIIGARANQLVAGATVGPLTLAYDALHPARALLKGVVGFISRHSRADGAPEEQEGILKEADFMLLVEEGHKEGAIHESELGLIKRVFELDNTTVSEVFKPLGQVQTVPATMQLKAALQLMRSQNYSRIPVVSSTRRIAGILYIKDLLRAKMDPALLSDPVSTVMRKPLTVAPTMRLNSLFRRFKQERTHMAIVQAESGEALGIVTMADVLEALFEDLLGDEEADPA